jgi:hypothetical protein
LVREVTKVDVWRKSADRRHFIGSSDARIIMGNDKDALLQLWPEKRGLVLDDRSGLVVGFGSSTEDFKRRGYDAITGRMPISWSVIARCYATAAILLASWPWNFLLLLLLFLSNRVPFHALRTTRSDGPERAGASGTCGGPL